MELKVSSNLDWLIKVKIENAQEDALFDDEIGDLRGELYIGGEYHDLEGRKECYPFEVELGRRQLGRVAARGMLHGKEPDILTSKQILTFFENNPTSIARPAI